MSTFLYNTYPIYALMIVELATARDARDALRLLQDITEGLETEIQKGQAHLKQ